MAKAYGWDDVVTHLSEAEASVQQSKWHLYSTSCTLAPPVFCSLALQQPKLFHNLKAPSQRARVRMLVPHPYERFRTDTMCLLA
eukprot:3074523-Amphidinium_carterae.3